MALLPKTKPVPIVHPSALNAMRSGTGGLYNPMPKTVTKPMSGLTPVKKPVVNKPLGSVAPGTPAPISKPASLKIGDTMSGGYTFAGYVQRNGKFVPLVRTKNGGTAIHPQYQKTNNISGGIGTVQPGAKKPVGATPSPTAPVTPAPTTPVVTPPNITAPSWIGNLFPNIGSGGITTNPTGGGLSGAWNPAWDSALAEWKNASSVDANYASAYSAALQQAMQDLTPLQSEVQSLLAVDPTTGRTRYQQELSNANSQRDSSVSSTYGNSAARGITRSGMMNQNLAGIANRYVPIVNDISQKYGDARLGSIGQAVAQRLTGLNMDLYNAYQQALANAYANVPQIGVA